MSAAREADWRRWFVEAFAPIDTHDINTLNPKYLGADAARKAFAEGVKAEDYAKRMTTREEGR